MKPQRLFDGASLRADLFNGSAQRLFVSFRQRVGVPGSFSDATPVRNFTGNGFAHLYLQSKHNDWYVNSETEALESVLEGHCTRYTDAVAMGFSMGAMQRCGLHVCLDCPTWCWFRRKYPSILRSCRGIVAIGIVQVVLTGLWVI
jgi:hypothetical protein